MFPEFSFITHEVFRKNLQKLVEIQGLDEPRLQFPDEKIHQLGLLEKISVQEFLFMPEFHVIKLSLFGTENK